jgi:hypothetical protein
MREKTGFAVTSSQFMRFKQTAFFRTKLLIKMEAHKKEEKRDCAGDTFHIATFLGLKL